LLACMVRSRINKTNLEVIKEYLLWLNNYRH
jgi:hypothetical protein